MSEPNQSNQPNTQLDPNTRVDTAHSGRPHEAPGLADLPIELLQAIAGRASEHSHEHTREHALELANILREKQQLLEQRESELNARTAVLENEFRSRSVRRGYTTPLDAGIDLSADESPVTGQIAGNDLDSDAFEPAAASELATMTPPAPPTDSLKFEPAPTPSDRHGEERQAWQPVTGPQEPEMTGPQEPEMTGAQPASEENRESELSDARSEIAREQQELDAAKSTFEKRKNHVENLHGQITKLHLDSLELQLATQQMWSELMENYPSEELAQGLAETRNRIRDDYRLANEALAEKSDDLHQARLEVHRQESRLRHQRRELQLWADRRYDEIETRTAQLIQRERELDRLESEFNRQSLQWQEQREAYRHEIGRLAHELKANS